MQNEETPNSNLDKLSKIKSLLSKLSSSDIKTKHVSVDNIIEKINEFSKSIEEESSNTNENNLMRKRKDKRIFEDFVKSKEIKFRDNKIFEQKKELLENNENLLRLRMELNKKNEMIEKLTNGLEKMRLLFSDKKISKNNNLLELNKENFDEELFLVKEITNKAVIEKKNKEIENKNKEIEFLKNFISEKNMKMVEIKEKEETEINSEILKKNLLEKVNLLENEIKILSKQINENNDNLKHLNKIINEKEENIHILMNEKEKLNENEKILKVENLKNLNEINFLKEEIEYIKIESKEFLQKQDILKQKILDLQGNIRVFLRIRNDNQENFVKNLMIKNDLIKIEEKEFDFDKIFAPNSNQKEIYEELEMMVKSIFNGYNVMVSCYGQTGSGKTYTMEGDFIGEKKNLGIFPRAIKTIFNEKEELKKQNYETEFEISVVEIYNDSVNNFINKKSEIKYIKVETEKEIYDFYFESLKKRKTAETKMNEKSSRSHFLIFMKVSITKENEKRSGEIVFLDLAGSERVGRSKVTGDRLKEAQNINSSLLGLRNVIFALKESSERKIENVHIPYRNCKLTYILKPLIEKKIRIVLFVNVSLHEDNIAETICSLRFGLISRDVKFGKFEKNVEIRN